MHPEAKLVPLGILEVDSGQLFLSLGQSAETSDFIADGSVAGMRDLAAQAPHQSEISLAAKSGHSSQAHLGVGLLVVFSSGCLRTENR